MICLKEIRFKRICKIPFLRTTLKIWLVIWWGYHYEWLDAQKYLICIFVKLYP